MLAKCGSPPISNEAKPIGILKTSVATHAADGIDAVLRISRTAEPHLSLNRSGSAVAIVTATFNIGIVQMDSMQVISPGDALARGCIRAAPECAVACSALSLVVDTIGIVLVRI